MLVHEDAFTSLSSIFVITMIVYTWVCVMHAYFHFVTLFLLHFRQLFRFKDKLYTPTHPSPPSSPLPTPLSPLQFSDVLLHTQPSGTDLYRFRNSMPIYGMKVIAQIMDHLSINFSYVLCVN